MRQNLVAQFVQLLKHWLCNMQLSIAMRKNRALSVDQCRLQVLQFLVHGTDFLNILLRCNGFAKIQKAIVDQMGSRPPNSDQDPFFGVSLALGSALELLLGPATELIIAGCHMQSIFHCTSQSDRERVHCFVE